MLYHCPQRWPNIKTTLRRRFVFDAFTTVSSMLISSIWKVPLFVSNTQWWFNAEQPSATLAPHWNSIGYRPLYFNWLNVEGAQRVQAGRVASDNGPLYWLAKMHSWASSDMYINVPTLIPIVIQKILNKSGRTWRMTWKSHSIPAQNIRIIVPRFEVDWITTQGEIAHYKPPTCTSLAKHWLALSDPDNPD